MGTRGVVVVAGIDGFGGSRVYRLYVSIDAYPTGVVGRVTAAVVSAQAVMDVANAKWKESKPVMAGTLAGKLIGEMTTNYGMNTYLEGTEDGPFEPSHLGDQRDLEWIYLVNTDTRSVDVYGGGYTGKLPQVAYKAGVVDPLRYAEQLKPEYQDEERAEILKKIGDLESLGWTVNGAKPAPKKPKKTKA